MTRTTSFLLALNLNLIHAPQNEILIPFKGSLLQVIDEPFYGCLPPPAPGEIHTLDTFQCTTTESQTKYNQRYL